MEDIAEMIQQFGFPIVAMLGLGYFVYFVWNTITEKIDPATEDMKVTIIKLIDQIRMMDNDMIRLQKKLDTVLQNFLVEFSEYSEKKTLWYLKCNAKFVKAATPTGDSIQFNKILKTLLRIVQSLKIDGGNVTPIFIGQQNLFTNSC